MVNIAEIPAYVLEQLGAATYNAVLAYMSTPEGAARLKEEVERQKSKKEEPT